MVRRRDRHVRRQLDAVIARGTAEDVVSGAASGAAAAQQNALRRTRWALIVKVAWSKPRPLWHSRVTGLMIELKQLVANEDNATPTYGLEV